MDFPNSLQPNAAGYLRLAERMIWFNVADAARQARRGVPDENNAGLSWLWDVARSWAEITGGDAYKKMLCNLCEEISITADLARRGERYHSNLLKTQLKRRDKSHL